MEPAVREDQDWGSLVADVMASAPLRPERSPMRPEVIVRARGWDARPHYAAYVERLIDCFPGVTVRDEPDTPPARVRPEGATDLQRRERGKRTLVVGQIGRLIDQHREREPNVVCHPYWHFNLVGYCPFDCQFCYVAGSQGLLGSPAVRIYLNVEELLAAMQRRMARSDTASGATRGTRGDTPIVWYGSKLQDLLALDPLTNFGRILVPFMAEQERGKLLLLTKSNAVEGLLDLDHRGRTILSWSLNAEDVCARFERGTPSLQQRLDAARRVADAGYEVRFVFMPLIPIERWRAAYADLVERALAAVTPSRITLGGICSFPTAGRVQRERFGALQPIEQHWVRAGRGRWRYQPDLRVEMYRFVADRVRERHPDLPVSLCLETADVWAALGWRGGEDRCNCLA